MKDTVSIPRKSLEDAVRTSLENAQVPRKQMLALARALQGAQQNHKRDIEAHRLVVRKLLEQFVEYHESHKKQEADVEALKKKADDELKTHRKELERVGAIPPKQGEPGPPGKPGANADPEKVITEVLARIVVPKGAPGEPGKNAEFDEEKLFTKFVDLLQKNKLLSAEHIKGIQGWIKDGVKYRYEELMHGGGSKEYSVASGQITGTIDGSNKVFTLPFASTNWKVYLDGQRSVSPTDYTIAGTALTCAFAPTTSVVCDS